MADDSRQREPSDAPQAGESHDPYSALRYRDFRRFLVGQFLACLGVQMQTVGLGWYLYERTSSALALGGVGLAQVLPIFLLTLPAGHLADHLDRKSLLQATLALAASCSLGLAWLAYGHGSVALVYALLVLNGIARALMAPARDALGPQLLPIELLGNGATWRSGLLQLAAVLGPSVGGLIIGATRSATPVFLAAAVSIVVFMMLVVPIRARPYERGTRGPVRKTMVGGVRFIWHNRILLATITLDLFAVLLGGATMLTPVFARDIRHMGLRGLGWMLAAPSVGAVLVAVLLARRPLRRAGRSLLWAVADFGAATVVFGLSRSFPLSLLMLALLGGFDMVSMVVRSTLVQVLTPDELRGRVRAVNALFIGTSNELGGFESGATAALFGPVIAAVAGGFGSILIVLGVARIWPEVARVGSLHETSPAA